MNANISIKKVNNGFVVSWLRFLEKTERIDSQATREITAVALDESNLLKIIEIAAKDVETLVAMHISGSIYRER